MDAPDFREDYMSQLLDWSSRNAIATALGSQVYVISMITSKTVMICDTAASASATAANAEDPNPILPSPPNVSAISWTPSGTHLAVGDTAGHLTVWDCERVRQIRSLEGHLKGKLVALDWNAHCLASGDRNGNVLLRDPRMIVSTTTTLSKQQVCGLKWAPDTPQLAIGDAFGHVRIYDARRLSAPMQTLCPYSATPAGARALAWSPHRRGLLAVGGGTLDPTIRFWDTLGHHRHAGKDGMDIVPCSEILTTSQVCTLAWSTESNELVSTHGFCDQKYVTHYPERIFTASNSICIWRHKCDDGVVVNLPSQLELRTQLRLHNARPIHMARSPDNEHIVTGASDECIMCWSVFPTVAVSNTMASRSRTLLK